jgi:hypothetical protein
MEDYELAIDMMKKETGDPSWMPWDIITFLELLDNETPVMRFSYKMTEDEFLLYVVKVEKKAKEMVKVVPVVYDTNADGMF